MKGPFAVTLARLTSALSDRYRIEREIGSGGMATVYLAHDLKHDRKVAVKILKPELAAVVGTERFLTEIRTTANLNHAHILPLFDSGEEDGFLFYVMPYVESDSLRVRIDRDGQLPVEEAVRIAGLVADALDYAHQEGVIHRDIKPGNILFQAGDPVVTDFGIALAIRAAGEGRLTETGLSLGTPYYMSPEQATGEQTTTAASDVYSLGCVLYEMLTGEPPHTGASAQAILGKILLGEVTRPKKLRRTTPANVEGAVLKALEQLPADRFASASLFAGALQNSSFRHESGMAQPSKGWSRKTVSWVALAMVSIVAALVVGLGEFERDAMPGTVVRVRLPLQEDQLFAAAVGVDLALAPNGSRIVYVGVGGDVDSRLFQRALADFQPLPIPGTENPSNPAVSPDGRAVAFISAGALKVVSLNGGPVTTVLAEGVSTRGLDWGSDGFLYFTDLGGAVQRVPEDPAQGGLPDAVTFPEPGVSHTGVDVLPGGKGVLITVNDPQTPGRGMIGVADLQGGPVRPLVGGSMARFLPPGFLLFSNNSGQLFAASFDLGRLEVTSGAMLMADGLAGTNIHYSEFAVSETGSLAYRGTPQGSSGDLVWVSRDGSVEEVNPDWDGDFRNPSLSPDGRRLAVDRVEGFAYLWISDLERRGKVRLNRNSAGEHRPAWSPDGFSVTYSEFDFSPEPELWTVRADGSGEPRLSLQLERGLQEGIWSGDGEWLIARSDGPDTGGGDILALRSATDSVMPLITTRERELSPSLSPDSRYLAFTSAASGQFEVVVTPFPNTGDEQWHVSANGGTEPVWGHSGRELFFRNADGELVVVDVTATPEFSPGQERVLFSARTYRADPQHPQYDVSQDGERFLMIRTRQPGTYALAYVGNFLEEVKARVGR